MCIIQARIIAPLYFILYTLYYYVVVKYYYHSKVYFCTPFCGAAPAAKPNAMAVVPNASALQVQLGDDDARTARGLALLADTETRLAALGEISKPVHALKFLNNPGTTSSTKRWAGSSSKAYACPAAISLITAVGSCSLETSVSSSDGQCVWHGAHEIHGNSSSTIAHAFCMTAHVSLAQPGSASICERSTITLLTSEYSLVCALPFVV